MPVVLPQIDQPVRRIGAHTFDFSRRAAVMAVVNRTPDSFHDRGATFALEAAVDAGLKAVGQGADWLDVGGVPFSPLVQRVSPDQEAGRVVPVIEAIRASSDVVISVDTTRAAVAAAAIEAGADVVNDTSGLSDPDMARVVRDSGASVVITHSLAKPFEVLERPHYDDVTREVVTALGQRLDQALSAGVGPEQVILDPGPDLNKNTLHTLQLTRQLALVTGLGHPVLAAVSNKDFVGETLDRPRQARTAGSVASAMWCLMAGARILRMHDVPEAVDTVRMFEAIMGWREPAYLRHNM